MQNLLNRLSLKNKLLNSDYYWLSKAASIYRAAFLLRGSGSVLLRID